MLGLGGRRWWKKILGAACDLWWMVDEGVEVQVIRIQRMKLCMKWHKIQNNHWSTLPCLILSLELAMSKA